MAATPAYNIRGVEANRIGLDIDGISLPDATGRPYVSRVGLGTFGIGRDYIDPELFSGVDIASGTSNPRSTSAGIGGSVGFRTKSPEDYLRPGKDSYFSYKGSYDSANKGWGNSITTAGQSGTLNGILNGILVYSRRDAQQTGNNGTLPAPPDDWHSDALLLKGNWQPSAEQRLTFSVDHYQRGNKVEFDTWNTAATAITARSRQDSDTQRTGVQLTHRWTPVQGAFDMVESRIYQPADRHLGHHRHRAAGRWRGGPRGVRLQDTQLGSGQHGREDRGQPALFLRAERIGVQHRAPVGECRQHAARARHRNHPLRRLCRG